MICKLQCATKKLQTHNCQFKAPALKFNLTEFSFVTLVQAEATSAVALKVVTETVDQVATAPCTDRVQE
jgi:hypothetical protein